MTKQDLVEGMTFVNSTSVNKQPIDMDVNISNVHRNGNHIYWM